jgi:hypothetical protein
MKWETGIELSETPQRALNGILDELEWAFREAAFQHGVGGDEGDSRDLLEAGAAYGYEKAIAVVKKRRDSILAKDDAIARSAPGQKRNGMSSSALSFCIKRWTAYLQRYAARSG